MNDGAAGLVIIFYIALYIVFGLIPYWIGKSRGHNDTNTLLWVSLLLGWFPFVWLGMFIWSLAGASRRQQERNRLLDEQIRMRDNNIN